MEIIIYATGSRKGGRMSAPSRFQILATLGEETEKRFYL